ncbi:MAG: hypothetical protein K2O01_03080, partial [Bacteroidales bacterium]|nr:hypothetical protein [Bacteroidales bacterium]
YKKGDVELVEAVALSGRVHPCFNGGQLHPENKSTVENPHPLFCAFVQAAIERQEFETSTVYAAGNKADIMAQSELFGIDLRAVKPNGKRGRPIDFERMLAADETDGKPKKRKPGRPRKRVRTKAALAKAALEAAGIKRRPGRPRKDGTTTLVMVTDAATDATARTKKRATRTPKGQTAATKTKTAAKTKATAKAKAATAKRGRKPKAGSTAQAAPKRPVGRPRLVPSERMQKAQQVLAAKRRPRKKKSGSDKK